jgi:hypothetical protein
VSGRKKALAKIKLWTRGSRMFPGSDVCPFRSAGAGPMAGGKGWPRPRGKRRVSERALLDDEMHEDMTHTQHHHGIRCTSHHRSHGSIRVDSYTSIAHTGGWTRSEDFRHRRQRRRVGHRCLRRRRTSRTAQWRPLPRWRSWRQRRGILQELCLVFQIERLLSKCRERRRLRKSLFICTLPSQWCCQMAVCLHALHKELDVILSIQHPPATIGAFHANGDGQVGIQYCGVHGFLLYCAENKR